MRLVAHEARMEEWSNAYKYFVGNPERKKPLGRLRHRWKDNIKTELKEV
jgi:hypothetical protein